MAAWDSPRRSDPDCLARHHPGTPATQGSSNDSRSGWGERKVEQGPPGSPSFESHSSTASAPALAMSQPPVTSAVPPRCPQLGTCSLERQPRPHSLSSKRLLPRSSLTLASRCLGLPSFHSLVLTCPDRSRQVHPSPGSLLWPHGLAWPPPPNASCLSRSLPRLP